MSEKHFYVEGSSSNRKKSSAKCKTCKNAFEKGQLRIARLVLKEDTKKRKLWYHVDCIFKNFRRAHASTVKITNPNVDLEGWNDITEQDKVLITEKVTENNNVASVPKTYPFSDQDPMLFNTFCSLCACLEAEPKYKKKSEIISNYLFRIKSEVTATLVVRMLLSKTTNSDRIYNLKPVSLMRIFSKIFMRRSLESLKEEMKRIGDVSVVIGDAYAIDNNSKLSMKSLLSLAEMDDMLFELSGKSKDKQRIKIVKNILDKLRSREEVINFIRLILGDLRTKASVKHILDGVGEGAYDAFCISRDINEAVLAGRQSSSSFPTAPRVFVPVMPMLAQPCKSLAAALEKVGRGNGQQLYTEIKYDGERVQVHKKENRFAFFSRALRPMAEHKVEDLTEYVVDAFPEAESIILDGEILLVCKKTGKPLPFCMLSKNKRKDVADSANICLFIFDILLYNGENMLNRPLSDRRALLETVMVQQKSRVVLSELVKIGKEELDSLLQQVLKNGLEGLMIKDAEGKYEPGKRHWLKIGAIAYTVELVVLGASLGKGGLLSTFQLGCLDKKTDEWKTVTTVHTGFDDAKLDEMKAIMVKNEEEERSFKLVTTLNPDYIVKNPKEAPVWQLEFTNHTASVKRERRDKNWETATSLEDLEMLMPSEVAASTSVKRKGEEEAETEPKKICSDNK